jgi:hypothetical protein
MRAILLRAKGGVNEAWLRFGSAADQDERQSYEQEGGRCGNGNLRGLFFVDRSLEGANLRNLLLLMVGVGRMQNCGDAEQEQHNADDDQCAFHVTNLSTTNVTLRNCASPFARAR